MPLMEGTGKGGRPYLPEAWPIARSLASNEIISDEEIRVAGADGRSRSLFASAAPIRDKSGKTVAVVGTFSEHSSGR
jgi:hypothetical protein